MTPYPKRAVPWYSRWYHLSVGPNPLHPNVWNGRLAPLTLRPFTAADLDVCLEIYSLNEPGRFPAGVKDWFRASLLNTEGAYLVAEKAGRVVACGGIRRVRRPDMAVLSYGLVHPEFQGCGVGAGLVLGRLALLCPKASWGYTVFILAVEKSLGYYRRYGFRKIMQWRDQQGNPHPMAAVAFSSRQVRRCRELLQEHGVSAPWGNLEVPFVEETSGLGKS